jgi:hypothetical protein
MNLTINKTGSIYLDVLLAYGLAVAISVAYQCITEVSDRGGYFQISYPKINRVFDGQVLIDQLFLIPSEEEILGMKFQPKRDFPLSFKILDGLLAATLTRMGIKISSILDLASLENHYPGKVKVALEKIQDLMRQIVRVQKQCNKRGLSWLDQVESFFFDRNNQVIRITGKRNGASTSIPMTIEPAFAYSPHNPVSNSNSLANNFYINEPLGAWILIYVGASRFLCTQKVSGNFLIYYLRIPSKVQIAPQTFMRMIPGSSQDIRTCLAKEYLFFPLTKDFRNETSEWEGVAYQILQTQSGKNAIGVSRGILDLNWICNIADDIGKQVIYKWIDQITYDNSYVNLDKSYLINWILNHHNKDWFSYMNCWSRYILHQGVLIVQNKFTFQETQEIINMMEIDTTQKAWTAMLARKKGTRRIGENLRMLREFKIEIFRDLGDILETVNTPHQMAMFVSQVALECSIAKVKHKFIARLDDQDLLHICQDIESYGLENVIDILRLVSAFEYPPKIKQELEAKDNGNI